MTTNKALRFYKKSFSSSDPSLTNAGALVFDTAAQAIYVGGQLATSNVIDATFDSSNVLTITKVGGSKVTLDFSDVASASAVNSLLAGLRTDINNLQTATGIADGSTAPNYGENAIIGDASTMVAADLALAAAIADLSSGIDSLDVSAFAQASVSGSTITIKGIEETDGKIASTDLSKLEIALDGTYDATDNKIATESTVTDAIADVSMAEHTVAAGRTISSISQTKGVISVSDASIAIDHTQVTDWTSNVGVTAVGEGTTNGTVSVTTNGGAAADVSVHGLKSAAYTNSSEYATYEQGAKADTALQSIGHGTDGSYVTVTVSAKGKGTTQNVSAEVTVKGVSTASAANNGLAEAYDVQQYVEQKTASLTGAMHFIAVLDSTAASFAAALASYKQSHSSYTEAAGDVFTWGNKEYVYDGTNFVEFGYLDPATTVNSVQGAAVSGSHLTLVPNDASTGNVTMTVGVESGYTLMSDDQSTKLADIGVDETAKSVTDGSYTLSNLVSDANYKHITVDDSNGVSDGSVTYKYEHPTTTANTAAAVKVGNDGLGHVVLGDALAAGDIAFTDASFTATNVGGALTELNGKITTIDGHKGAITTGDGLTDVAADGGSFAVKIDATNANGLSVGADGIALAVVTDSSNGAMTSIEHVKLSGIEEGAQENVIEIVKVNGTALTIDGSKAVDVSAVTAIVDGADGSYVTVTVTTTDGVATVTSSTTIGDVSNGTEGIAKATDVQAYVDYKAAEAAAVVDASTPIQVNDGSTVIATVGRQNISAEVQFNWEAYE